MPKRKLNWPALDWATDDEGLAERYGYSIEWVRKQRKRYAPETIRPRGDIDYTTIPWAEYTNQELSKINGKHPNHWGRMRRIHAPHTVRPRGRPPETGKFT